MDQLCSFGSLRFYQFFSKCLILICHDPNRLKRTRQVGLTWHYFFVYSFSSETILEVRKLQIASCSHFNVAQWFISDAFFHSVVISLISEDFCRYG
jgi:hypothetical protein